MFHDYDARDFVRTLFILTMGVTLGAKEFGWFLAVLVVYCLIGLYYTYWEE